MSALLQLEKKKLSHKLKLVPIALEHLSLLRYILARTDRADFYSVAPSYFAVTGRKGLWIYGDEKRGMLIARHPNVPDVILFFPPFGQDRVSLIEAALADPQIPPGKVQIARLAAEDDDIIRHFKGKGLYPAQERKLDWTYPVHILSTQKVLEAKGHDFKDFRKNVNRAERKHAEAIPLEIDKHDVLVRDLVLKWALCNKGEYSVEDLTAPTYMALYLMRSSSLSIQGLLIQEEGRPSGFMMWEETRPDSGQAAGLCNASISESKGISEFTHQEMCRVLQERGYSEVCIGGSEEPGLDAFKRKMMPEKSVGLFTISI
jgi:hypothetical protein